MGLEVHAQLLTNTKLFCGDRTRFGAEPNTHISPVTLGYPGTLPVLNKEAVGYGHQNGILPAIRKLKRMELFCPEKLFLS